MTRRIRNKTRPLSINAYIHRATIGLPRAQRLDTATELRQHLIERVTEYQAQGYPREEAEYLAVQGMGEPQVTNRELLGHFFTNKAGWLTLLALLTGISTWTYYKSTQWEGVRPTSPIAQDDTAILKVPGPNWPSSGPKYAAEIRFPAGTRMVIAAFLSRNSKTMRSSFAWVLPISVSAGLQKDAQLKKFTDQAELSYWQSRFRLVGSVGQAFPDINGKRTCPEEQVQVGNVLYALHARYPQQPGVINRDEHGVSLTGNLASGFCFDNNSNASIPLESHLPLNTWTSVMYVPAGPKGNEATLALLLYPSSRRDLPGKKPEEAYRYNAETGTWIRR